MFRNVVGVALLVVVAGCSQVQESPRAESSAAMWVGARDGALGVDPGTRVADARLLTATGDEVRLSNVINESRGPTVVTFYRGGWCPYCTDALTEWNGKLDDLRDAGARLVALTPEKPSHVSETVAKTDAGFLVLSDSRFEAADAFNLRFRLGDDTKRRYADYGIDVAASNATPVWDLPHPGTFVVDADGVVRYVWVKSDYTERSDPEEVIDVVRSLR